MRLEILFLVALFLYSGAIWSHRIRKRLRPWMVWTFGLGLATDLGGTVLLCVMSATRWQWSLHAISGLVSLAIMALHFAWAVTALRLEGRSEAYFDRFSVWAWAIWLVAFASGIPL